MIKQQEREFREHIDTRHTDSWLREQGIDPNTFTNNEHMADLARLLQIKPYWRMLDDRDRARWLGLWYRVHKLQCPLKQKHHDSLRNIFKRTTRRMKR